MSHPPNQQTMQQPRVHYDAQALLNLGVSLDLWLMQPPQAAPLSHGLKQVFSIALSNSSLQLSMSLDV